MTEHLPKIKGYVIRLSIAVVALIILGITLGAMGSFATATSSDLAFEQSANVMGGKTGTTRALSVFSGISAVLQSGGIIAHLIVWIVTFCLTIWAFRNGFGLYKTITQKKEEKNRC